MPGIIVELGLGGAPDCLGVVIRHQLIAPRVGLGGGDAEPRQQAHGAS